MKAHSQGDLIEAPLGHQICAEHTRAVGQADGTFLYRPSEFCQVTKLALEAWLCSGMNNPESLHFISHLVLPIWGDALGLGWSLSPLWVWHKFSYPCPYPILELIFIVSTAPKLTHTFWVIPPSWGWPRLSLWDATAPRPSHPSLSLLTHIFRFD